MKETFLLTNKSHTAISKQESFQRKLDLIVWDYFMLGY